MKKIKIGELDFVKTCPACPEQYDVFYKGKQVAYLRLRWGYFSVDIPDACGKEIFGEQIDDSGWQGEFDNDERRQKYLEIAKDKIMDNFIRKD